MSATASDTRTVPPPAAAPPTVALPGGLLRQSLILAGRSLRRLRRAPGKLIGITMNPLVMMITIGYLFKHSIVVPGTTHYEEYVFAGVCAQVGLSSLGPTAIGLANDVRGGVVDRLFTLPLPRMAVAVGHVLADLVAALMALVIVTGAGLLLGWRPHAGVLSVLAGFGLVTLFIVVMLWVGVVLGLVLRNPETIESVGALVLVLFSFLSTSFLSPLGLPGWIRPVAQWNPVSAMASACRRLWGNPVSLTDAWPDQHPGAAALASMAIVLAGSVMGAVLTLRRARA